MRFFIDTANLKEIQDALDMGILAGVTTNPTVISKSGKDFKTTIADISRLIGKERPIFAEVIATKAPEMIEEGRAIKALHGGNMIVKLPICKEAMKAISVLSQEGVHTCATLCFSAPQALVASLAGAAYVAPFIGRNDDIGWDGMQLIQEIQDMFFAQNAPTHIICASVRTPGQIVAAAKMGVNAVTMNHSLLCKLFNNPSSDLTLQQFLKDWEKVPK